MYCRKCGKDNPDDAIFCKECGANLNGSEVVPQGTPYGSNNYHASALQKSTGIGIILSIICVGFGHLYAGQISKGIILFIIFTVLMALSLVLYFPVLIALVMWIWGIYDVNNTINQYNQHIRNTGNPPW
ncbi:MAG TPA: zinc ribbon domain-containing protein [Candidatus Methanomethylophilaceae archaeon]|nr:zinc ribbon domain-containing protein [Candidatus Methanomethylophilaceae archaeon]